LAEAEQELKDAERDEEEGPNRNDFVHVSESKHHHHHSKPKNDALEEAEQELKDALKDEEEGPRRDPNFVMQLPTHDPQYSEEDQMIGVDEEDEDESGNDGDDDDDDEE
jgi:hypothetical protein